MTRLRIVAVLSNAVIWIVSNRPPTSKSSRPFNDNNNNNNLLLLLIILLLGEFFNLAPVDGR